MTLPADPTGDLYTALNFNRGFAPDAAISPYAKLLPMLAGVGSPGTIQEVRSFDCLFFAAAITAPLEPSINLEIAQSAPGLHSSCISAQLWQLPFHWM